jgi:hypothetical protein
MKRQINIAENWERAYDAFQQINFKAWDYQTIKESMVDYLKLYYPEDFNDYIESSDMIALIELFAYLGELLAYRIDLNTHENFLSTAERKESVLRLARYISYNPSRRIPARGLVKITSVKTTETVIDSQGNDLTNTTITWNDPNNDDWKEQFYLVMDKVLEQKFGTVLPSDRVQVQDVLFELYALKNNPLPNETLSYSVSVSNNNYPMELVSAEISEFGPQEKRPERQQKLNIIYANDGLGDSSNNTGFFFFTKQGQLRRETFSFDGVLPNQERVINDQFINNIDVWLNNIDDESNEIISGGERYNEPRAGEWQEVDVSNSQNILFNTSPNRNKYEVETLDNDGIRLLFGDGNFSNIPSGKFDLWYRVTEFDNEDSSLSIPRSAIQNKSSGFEYIGEDGRVQTFSFTFTLFSPIQNSAPSESIERIRSIAPSVYYTQDRMVNGRDYNEFMLQDNTILKLRAINRTFAGDSKYIGWHDPKEYYEDVKIFGDDLVLYFETEEKSKTVLAEDLPAEDGGLNLPLINSIIYNQIEPIFRIQEFYNSILLKGTQPTVYRYEFTDDEYENLVELLNDLIFSAPNTVYLTYNVASDQNNNGWLFQLSTEPTTWDISIESQTDNSWIITYNTRDMTVYSDDVNFTSTNESERVITYDTLNSNRDRIVVLKANLDADGNPLTENKRFFVLKSKKYDNGTTNGICDFNRLSVLPYDDNNNGLPDDITLNYLINSDDYVYFYRESVDSPWTFVPFRDDLESIYQDSLNPSDDDYQLWKRENGIEGVNFLWVHVTPRYELIDPAASNIIDSFIITRGYYANVKDWLNGRIQNEPIPPSSFELKSSYSDLIESKMISDTLILHPGKIKPVIGPKAQRSLQATLKVIKSPTSVTSNNRIKNSIVSIVNRFFDINEWNFGQPFYFTELSTAIHNEISSDIESVVIVPKSANHDFGDLFEIIAEEDEILQPSISVDDIEIVERLDSDTLKQRL